MESMPVVLDISSDEELGSEERLKSFDYDWIKEFLGVSDKESDDSDDVIVVHELKPAPKSKSSRPAAKESDDDCVVLDDDPENQVTSVNESPTESDELLIVGEKGQIACRDYPHPRHLCATFPFSSTPHERHCEKCHCYVCDLPSPCPKWGTGISSADHCHATEKVEMWKIQRKNFKLKRSDPLPASTNYGNSLPVGHSQHNQVVPLGTCQLSTNSISQIQASRLTTVHTCSLTNPIPQNCDSWPRPTIMRACSSSLNPTVQNQVSRANTIPMCFSTTSFTVPNGTNHGRCQDSVSTFIKNRHQSLLVPRQLLGVRNNAFQRDRRRGSTGLCPQYFRHFIIPNGPGNAAGGILPVNYSANDSYGYDNHVNPAVQCNRYHDGTGLPNDRTCNGWSNGWLPTEWPSIPDTSSVQPSLNGANIVASEIQAYTQPSCWENSQNFYQSCVQGNDAPSKYVGCLSSNLQENERQIGSQMENANGDIIQYGNLNQDSFQQEPVEENRTETARKVVFSPFDLVGNENTSQSIEPLTENSLLPTSGSINHRPNMNDSATVLAGSTNLSSLVDFENCLMENDAALPSELNFLSPDPIPVDMGTLFCDFETSCNGLAHAYS